MTPYYQDESVTIYCGDCREIVPMLGRFDLLLTDPPYGLAEKSNGGSWGNFGAWDAEAPDVLPLLPTASKAIIWGGNYFALPPSRCWLVWDKPEKMPSVADCELAWCSWDANAKLFRVSRNPDGKRSHPTQKPLALMAWCIGLAGDVQTILDPFAGSGTTGRAAKDLGRKAVLIEHVVDCVMAGMARSGSVYKLELPDELLQLAFQNTVEMMQEQVGVED